MKEWNGAGQDPPWVAELVLMINVDRAPASVDPVNFHNGELNEVGQVGLLYWKLTDTFLIICGYYFNFIYIQIYFAYHKTCYRQESILRV